MPDITWLNELSTSVDATLPTLAIRLVLAWLGGWLVSVLARRKQPAETPDTLTLTLVLMCVLIAMATQTIGDNIARAFSLVGALSIVRFRTAIPATRDVAFVLASVVVGMAVGAGQYWVAALGLVVVGLASHVNSPKLPGDDAGLDEKANSNQCKLTIRAGLSAQSNWEPDLSRMTSSFRLVSVETVRKGGAMEFVYRAFLRPEVDVSALISAINVAPSVESVALKLE